MNFTSIDRDNLSECVGLFVRVFNNAPWNESWSHEAATQQMDDCFRTPGFYGLIATIDEEALGFALGFVQRWDEIRHFHLKEMCVATERQRHGVGTALLHQLEDQLKSQGVQRLYLQTARETPAQSFYQNNGFGVSSRIITMTKWLNSD